MVTRTEREHDVIIVGAGILGSAAAVALGKQGRKVLLIERDMSEPDRIVGELLQPGGVKALHQLGLADCLEGIDAIPVHGYHCIYHNEGVAIPYTSTEGVPERGKSFHHGRFVMKLREAALKAPNVSVLEATANNIFTNSVTGAALGITCTVKSTTTPQHHFAPLTLIADGCFSKFRSKYIPKQPAVRSHFVGLVLKDADLPAPNHGHVILGNNPPVLVYQIGTHDTRILVDVPGKLPSVGSGALKKYLEDTVLPELPESIKPSFKDALETQRLRTMPNSFLPPSVNKTPGIIVLGDAMNMRHPLTGGGMTVAFTDVVLLRDLLSPSLVPTLSNRDLVVRQMEKFHWQRKHLSSVVNILAMALYALFAANDNRLRALQNGCFRYFQLGGPCVEGPVSLLSGIRRQPLVLFMHFFAVAIYAIYLIFAESSLVMWPVMVVHSGAVFVKACQVLFPYIWSEILP
ncbi:SE-domain-containing protein [Saitoella complicata NRRL Y-17804]|uniref:SE-domain-containing protein n=1 Tax=Saitoella complicata (strain BCRC 22490 / CBS 7301 / JCM 7358 / NBRC 10748 / NRRL Y-17804) TaxID=698492 RepID=UPI0008681E9C|nr:SE-domain-containing protein [Saitoella complicata NRRL Y-17804]ODQ52171.1 SE-domain-containing protein [Saitoella complicata NRRL Y-17804]